MTCDCRVCRYGREVEAHLAAIPEPHRAFFADMYESLCMTEMDLDMYRAKVENGELVPLSPAEQVMLKIMMSAPDAPKDVDSDSGR